ncbi:flagellar biosynthesis protein FlhB [Halonatronum saccharophilum]|uniref:flagellar biosynthesis protein FlhB n=1 Tax=Halonatronum saccharophilum TaxID=150060 RepID=UPI00048534E5|nr:flagellar biosynthesis protein FlhB [Halonatronum saccharophilum]
MPSGSSGEKTEKATPKKKKEAREEGQVASSKELNSAFTLLTVFLIMYFLMSYILKEMIDFTTKVLVHYFDMQLSIRNFHNLIIEIGFFSLRLLLPVMIGVAFVGVMVSLLQVGVLFTPKVIQPKLSKINPISGFKRLFSKRTLVEFLKSMIKITVVGYTAYLVIMGYVDDIILLLNTGLSNALNIIGNISFSLAMRVSMVFIVVGIADFIYQKWQHEEDLKMTKQEVKEERKQVEGSPEIKSKRRQKQQEMAMSRMMQDVPDATVVITNPTHIAIAVKFNMDEMDVPLVVAKGQDEVAQRIKEIAKENDVEVVEEKPLARALYKIVDVGDEIPMEFYQAIAEILAYIYQTDKERRF